MQEGSAISHPEHAGHLVQLFDSDESLADGVAQFVRDGLMRRERIMAVMDEQRWYAVAMRLSAGGWPADEPISSGHLVVCSAKEMLDRLMRADRVQRDLFAATVGTLVSGVAALGKPVRIYGEMVDILAAQGQYAAAHELEELWNDLGRRHQFTLLCGYLSGHFGDPRRAADLRRICAAHDEVRLNAEDVLGPYLLSHSEVQARN